MPENELTMVEIAKLAGVSQATVSRVLHNLNGVAPDKKKAVLDLVEQHQFTPRARRSGAARSNFCLGLLVTGPIQHMASELLLRTQQSLVAHLPSGAGLVFLPSFDDPDRVKQIVRAQSITGILLAGHHETPQLVRFLEKIPHVWLNSREVGNQRLALSGNELAGSLAAQTFIAGGCEKLYVIDYPSHNPGLRLRVDGFRFEAMRTGKEAVILTAPASPFEDSAPAEITERLTQLVSTCDFRGCGLFCPDDRLTVVLYPILKNMSLLPGQDLLLISCNNQKETLAGLLPRPATIDLSPELTAEMALARLLKKIEGNPESERLEVIVKPELVAGETAIFAGA